MTEKHPSEMTLPELYIYMKANPADNTAQLLYFKALADGRLSDFYTLADENEKLQGELDKIQEQLNEAAEVLQVFAQFANDASVAARDGSDHVTIRVRVHAVREARRLLGGSFRDYSSLEDIPV